MNMLLMACAVVGWSKVVWFVLLTHFKWEKSGSWKAGAVPRGLSVGNVKCIQLLPLPQVEEGFFWMRRCSASIPAAHQTGGTKPALEQKTASCGGFNPLRAAPP